MHMLSLLSVTLVFSLLLPSLADARMLPSVSKPTRGQERNVYDPAAVRRAQFAPKPQKEVSWKTVCNGIGGFCFEHPDTWKLYGTSDMRLLPIKKHAADDRKSAVHVHASYVVEESVESAELERLFLGRATLHPEYDDLYFLPSFNLIGSDEVMFLGAPARRLEYTADQDGSTKKFILYLSVRDGIFHSVSYDSPIATFEEDLPVFERMLSSMKLKEKNMPSKSRTVRKPTRGEGGSAVQSAAERRREERLKARGRR